jgi:hypothetical protein
MLKIPECLFGLACELSNNVVAGKPFKNKVKQPYS